MNFFEEQYNFYIPINKQSVITKDTVSILSEIDLSKITNNKPQNILLKNVVSNIYSVPGYIMQLNIPSIFNDLCFYSDGSIVLENIYNRRYFSSDKLRTGTTKIELKRIAGGVYDGINIKAVDNPCLFLTLVLQYPIE